MLFQLGNNCIQKFQITLILRPRLIYQSSVFFASNHFQIGCSILMPAKYCLFVLFCFSHQIIASSRNLSLTNVQESHSGRYVCLAEYDRIKVFSQSAELDVFGKYRLVNVNSCAGTFTSNLRQTAFYVGIICFYMTMDKCVQ